MTRSTLAILIRLKAGLSEESKALVMRGRAKRGLMRARQAVAVGEAIEANKELMILKNEKVSWK